MFDLKYSFNSQKEEGFMKTTMAMRTICRLIAVTMCMVAMFGTSLPVVAASGRGALINTTSGIAEGTLDDGTPYTVYKVQSIGLDTNIVDSQKFEIMVVLPWGTTPPATWNVSIPKNGTTYKGTLRHTLTINNFWEYRVEAYYSGYIFGHL